MGRVAPRAQASGFSFSCCRHSVRPANSATIVQTFTMLFMVIERFKPPGTAPIGQRFHAVGHMLPADVTYRASWTESL